jgi:hypothetical protein
MEENRTLIEDSISTNGERNESSSKGTGSYQTCPAAIVEQEVSSYYTDADDAFPSEASPSTEFKSAEDYEKFLLDENKKLIAHTLAEMAYCTNSSTTTDDFRSLVSGSSFADVLDVSDLSLRVSDEDEVSHESQSLSRATYNVSSDSKSKKKAMRDFDLTYKLESPKITTSRSTGFMSTAANNNRRSSMSSDTTYSLDPPPAAAVPAEVSNPPTTISAANKESASNSKPQVRIRETRSSQLRTERARKARSMEVRSTDYKYLPHSPSTDSSSRTSIARGSNNRVTFVKAVTRPQTPAAASAGVFTCPPVKAIPAATTASPCSIQSMTQSSSVAAAKYMSHTAATASKSRTGVQAKFSAFLQRIRS